MRQKSLAAIVAIALAVAIGFSVIGQEEPLPVVTPKYVVPEVTIVEPVVVLASEPIREYRPPTILDAARNNDYVTFDALYTAAKRRGDEVSAWDTLHELWTYSDTDPIGAFYGVELYERLSRAYPGFAAYIEPYRIVDSKGQVFYPTSETRAFLLARAVEGRPAPAPKVLVAETKPAPAPAVTPSVARGPVARVATAPPPARSLAPARDDTKAGSTPVPPAVVEQPVVLTAAEPAPQAAPQPAPVAQAPAPVVQQPVARAPAPPAAAATTTPTATRGLLLMIIGLIGIGLLAVILRTPKEEPMVIKPKPSNVEPLRKPQAATPAVPQPPSSDTRAAG